MRFAALGVGAVRLRGQRATRQKFRLPRLQADRQGSQSSTIFSSKGPLATGKGDIDQDEARRQQAGGYDAKEVEEQALKDPLGVAARAAQVAWLFGRYFLTLKFDEWRGNNSPETVKNRSKELRRILTKLGACYIKVGQALANRPDIIRHDYMEELEKLQDSVPPFPTEEAFQILRRELGKDLDQVFSELSQKPVAAASLGQVYRGLLRQNGAEVAVKVQRPGLKEMLCKDMYIFRQLTRLVNSWAEEKLGCNITLVVDEFASKLWEEANYSIEAANAQSFAVNFRNDRTVKIPKVYLQYTTQRVITLEWINGVKCTNVAALKRSGINIDVFMQNGVQAALRQLFEFGLFHGDPHAGNVLAMRDGSVAYIDFGNVASISSRQRDVLLRAVTHSFNADYEALVQDFVRLGFLRPGLALDEIVPAMGKIWTTSLGKSVKDFNFRTVTAQFSKLVYQFPLRVPARFSLVIRSLLLQEGICFSLNENFSVIEVALPYASRRLLSDPNPSMRRELMNVIFRDGERGRPQLQWDRVKNIVSLAKQAREGSNLTFNEVIVNLFRGLRRDFLAMERGRLPPPDKVLSTGLDAISETQSKGARQVLELLRPDLTPELCQQVADALLRDSLVDLLKSRGLKVEDADLADPSRLRKVLREPDQLRKLLPLPLSNGF